MSDRTRDSKVVTLYPLSHDPRTEVPAQALQGETVPPVEEGLRLMHAYFAIREPAVRTALMKHAEDLARSQTVQRQVQLAGTQRPPQK